jgi:glyoxylase-like metal-dependent hydrolase (beta-lactamase superfamily II)
MLSEQIIKTARYSPISIINYFYKNKAALDKNTNEEFAVYVMVINNSIIKLFIRKSDNLLQKIITLSDDELLGDVTNMYNYINYKNQKNIIYPETIQITKINNKINDVVKISEVELVSQVPELLVKPVEYKIIETKEITPEVVVQKYSNNIYFIELKHTDDKVMIVEFNDFILVAEAPLNSKNGELVIQEVKKLIPNKSIKYFVFGHFHPHYIGGIRAFIHKGVKILSTKMDEDYVQYLAKSFHTINPDSLQINPKKLQIETIEDKKIISDDKFELVIYFIGAKSKHTKDYLIYYFPSEKLLFEDDLAWINKEGEIRKAGGRQSGLYNSIKELGLDVNTIIQSWPVSDYGVKTTFKFEDLEKSMQVK